MAQAGRAVIDQQERTKAGASGDGPAWRPLLPSMNRSADATGGLCLGQSCANALGLGGHRPPTSYAGYISVHCLPLLSRLIKKNELAVADVVQSVSAEFDKFKFVRAGL